MSRVVWKYALQPGVNAIRVPLIAKVVAVGPWEPGADGPAVWIERDRDAEPDALITLQAVGTGHEVPAAAAHLGSAWCGPFMWHVYELASPTDWGEPT